MAEYIERGALLEKIEEYEPLNWTGSDAEMQADSDYRFYRALVEEQPIADVVEVRHGEWIPTRDNDKKTCSRCAVTHLIGQYPFGNSNYCPNCGAKMSGKARPSLMRKTLGNVMLSDLSVTDKECVATVFKRYNERVEVVRCKKCKHFCPYEGEEHKGDCAELVGLESCVYEEDFCSYGERKDG